MHVQEQSQMVLKTGGDEAALDNVWSVQSRGSENQQLQAAPAQQGSELPGGQKPLDKEWAEQGRE